jgi:hypothetical protein
LAFSTACVNAVSERYFEGEREGLGKMNVLLLLFSFESGSESMRAEEEEEEDRGALRLECNNKESIK